MEIFNFKDIDQKNVDHRMANLYFIFKLVGVVLLIYIFKFVLKYHYQSYLPLLIFLYLLTMLSYPIIKKIFKNTFIAIFAFYFSIILFISIMIFMSGGIRAPGNLWLSLLPFLGASLLGGRGFHWGVIFVSINFIILLALNHFGIEMYPFANLESFQFEFRVNLIIFTFTAFYFTYFHVKSENDHQIKLRMEQEKNENLLRILFHDLANPMQTIRMVIKKINSNRQIEDLPKNMAQLDKTSLRIVEILENVRKMKAIEDKKIQMNLAAIYLTDCFNKTEELFEAKLKEKELTIKVLNPTDDKTQVFVDPVYFVNQVLSNLISNAIKFSEKGSEITIEWTQSNQNVSIKISDKGIGIPKDILDNLFKENRQVSRVGTYGEIGTGYGMPLVKTFIQEFRGSIEIVSLEKNNIESHSQPLHGTTILINLPLVADT